ncbi:MAG: fibronectin type III domain-containing protein [Verrucomicrobiaceae bacterium]|nr:fibronectin type III domain-containing protein [Verrucomicrobiaceae bacterium]
MSFSMFRLFQTIVLALACQIGVLHAVTVVSGPEVNAQTNKAEITWKTDVVSGTKVSFGKNERFLAEKAEGSTGLSHTVQLSNLEEGTTYFFAFGTARVQLGTGRFTTAGSRQVAASSVDPKSRPISATAAKSAVLIKPTTDAPMVAPATSMTWGNLDSLQDHFDRHGADFAASSPDDYAAKAWRFLQRAKREGLPMKWDDSDRTLRVWDPKSRSFAAYDSRGKARTYFKPSNPTYWDRQPGRSVSGAVPRQ